jgi:bifunctional non-homologous end joining protein LigD
MAEQLSLRLEPGMPRSGDVAPMWPVPRRDPFDSPDYLFGPTWGGNRVLVFVEPAERPGEGAVRIVDGAGRDLAVVLPELGGVAVRVAAHSAVLDGELVVADAAGRADDDALRERLSGRPGRPVALLVFDVLHVDGVWLLGRSLEKRRDALRKVLRPGDEVVIVPSIPGEGLALHEAVTTQGIAGVLARRRTSPYLPGVRSRLWQSITAGPRGEGSPPPSDGLEPATTSTGPVLALFRRLPLGTGEDG